MTDTATTVDKLVVTNYSSVNNSIALKGTGNTAGVTRDFQFQNYSGNVLGIYASDTSGNSISGVGNFLRYQVSNGLVDIGDGQSLGTINMHNPQYCNRYSLFTNFVK